MLRHQTINPIAFNICYLSGRNTKIFNFLFSDPEPNPIFTLSLHDALPISKRKLPAPAGARRRLRNYAGFARAKPARSEEHTSELQSPYDLVCRLLLEKKKCTAVS